MGAQEPCGGCAASLPQTIYMLGLSRGEAPRFFPPDTRRGLLNRKWIIQGCEAVVYELTDSGRRALAMSPYLGQAQRVLDQKEKSRCD